MKEAVLSFVCVYPVARLRMRKEKYPQSAFG